MFFLQGREDPNQTNTTISGPSSTRQRNAIQMAFRWRADGGPTLNARLAALGFSRDQEQYCLQTLYFRDFSRGPDPCPTPTLDPHMDARKTILCSLAGITLILVEKAA